VVYQRRCNFYVGKIIRRAITQQVFLGEQMKQPFQRHFAYHHPLFKAERTAKGNRWDNTVYYFWWEFLRRHDGYKKTCENDGKGQYAALYADFGNVHGLSFKDWWTKDDRGARLFDEPRLPRGVMAMTCEDIETLPADWEPQSLLIVAIPLNLRKRYIQQRLTSILAQRHKGQRGKTTPSQARYPIATKFRLSSLKGILAVLDLQESQPDLTLWEIGQKLSLTTKLTQAELSAGRGREDGAAVDKKNVLAVAVSKKLASARKLIEGVGRGVFPAFRQPALTGP
jgi:hypothetical protein